MGVRAMPSRGGTLRCAESARRGMCFWHVPAPYPADAYKHGQTNAGRHSQEDDQCNTETHHERADSLRKGVKVFSWLGHAMGWSDSPDGGDVVRAGAQLLRVVGHQWWWEYEYPNL